MTHRDGLPRFSARSVRCGDAGHRKAWATPSESLGKPPFRLRRRLVGEEERCRRCGASSKLFDALRRAAYATGTAAYQGFRTASRTLCDALRRHSARSWPKTLVIRLYGS